MRIGHLPLLTTPAIAFSDPACPPPLQVEASHPASRLDGVEIVSCIGNILTLRAFCAAKILLVVRAQQPTSIRSTENARALLRQGWDGTLGYSLYGLEITILAAGTVTITFDNPLPPAEIRANTPEQLEEFARELAARTSAPPETPGQFSYWQQTTRKKFAGWLMHGGFPDRVPLEAHTTETRDYPRFTLHFLEYRSQRDRSNTALISIPKKIRKAPVLLALHGHEASWGKADPAAYSPGHNDDFCAHFAERGWAVLQPATMNHHLQHPGWTLEGEWTWDAMVALDYALSFPEVDSDRVAVCGLSTGAQLAMNVLALDERVRAGVVGCILSTWNHLRTRFRIPPHCDCGITEQLSHLIEQCDWAALAAPKPVQFQHGKKDAALCPGVDPDNLQLAWNTGIMPIEEYAIMFREIERAYTLAGGAGCAVTHFHPGSHRVDNVAAFSWLQRWLSEP